MALSEFECGMRSFPFGVLEQVTPSALQGWLPGSVMVFPCAVRCHRDLPEVFQPSTGLALSIALPVASKDWGNFLWLAVMGALNSTLNSNSTCRARLARW